MRGEFVLYIKHSGKYIEIDFNMKIPFLCLSEVNRANYMSLEFLFSKRR